MTVIAMIRAGIDRMAVLCDLAEGRISPSEAAALMGLRRRPRANLMFLIDTSGSIDARSHWREKG